MEIKYESDKDKSINKEEKKNNGNKLGVKLAVSVVILFFASLLRFYLPEHYFSVSEKMTKSVDFVSAFNAVESGLSGEEKMIEAVKDACRYVFIGTDDEKLRVINIGGYIEKFKN